MNWFIICLMVLFVVLGGIILSGKGDCLIAGYNMAGKEEREKVNIKRLRLCAALMPLLSLFLMGGLTFAVIILVASFVVVYLANTWAMKK